MKTINVKDVIIGEGIPKIAVSIIGTTTEEIMGILENIDREKVDIVEWRADYFESLFNPQRVLETLKLIRKSLIDIPIIFTLRTLDEGGEKKIDIDYYTFLNKEIAASGDADLIDIQVFLNKEKVRENIENIRKENVFVIGSNHDFNKTPKKVDMINRLKFMESLGFDIFKLAVMPCSTGDVLDLLSVTDTMKKLTDNPIITISMGSLGIISRISGETFGSSVTFGAMGKVSAPGQISVEKLFNILHSIH